HRHPGFEQALGAAQQQQVAEAERERAERPTLRREQPRARECPQPRFGHLEDARGVAQREALLDRPAVGAGRECGGSGGRRRRAADRPDFVRTTSPSRVSPRPSGAEPPWPDWPRPGRGNPGPAGALRPTSRPAPCNLSWSRAARLRTRTPLTPAACLALARGGL